MTDVVEQVGGARPYVVGIIGGGQLCRMMYAASIRLGLRVRVLAEGPDVSAAQVGSDVTVGDVTDAATVLAFARGCDVITFDHEHVPPEVLQQVEAEGVAVRPGPGALIHAQDKGVMRQRLSALGIPCPRHQMVRAPGELREFGDAVGWPVIVKTTRGGYDGKGVWKINGPDEIAAFAAGLPAGSDVLAEEYIDFARELSVIVVRSPSDQAVAYPVSESVQDRGICTETITPAPGLDPDRAAAAQELGLRVARELGVVGVLAVELMQRRDGGIVVNELAMRPHNTGHWTIDGAWTSQFENHLRAIVDLPLGDPGLRAPWVAMANVLGGGVADLPAELLHCFARDRRIRVELYGKDVEPRRKVGHVTALDADLDRARRRAHHAANRLMGIDDEQDDGQNDHSDERDEQGER